MYLEADVHIYIGCPFTDEAAVFSSAWEGHKTDDEYSIIDTALA